MKKRPIKKPKQKQQTTKQPQAPTTPPTRMHQRLLTAVQVVAGLTVALVGLVGSIYGIWGPPWPTVPSFSVGSASGGSAFDVPFIASNKSIFFEIQDLDVTCADINIFTTTHSHFSFGGVRVVQPPGTLDASASRPYVCPFNRVINLTTNFPTKICLDIKGTFSWRLPFAFSYRSSFSSGVFFWYNQTSPPQWLQGIPFGEHCPEDWDVPRIRPIEK
jgi:hypothetical protein